METLAGVGTGLLDKSDRRENSDFHAIDYHLSRILYLALAHRIAIFSVYESAHGE